MKTRHARTIGAFRTSGVNPRPEPAQQSVQQPPVPRMVLPRPEDAQTMTEALAGLQASATNQVSLVTPRFSSTAGPWMRLGQFDIRIPPDVIFAMERGRSGEHVAVLAYLDSSREAGRVQVLVTRPRGVLEMVGLWPEQLRQLKEVFLGR